MLGGVLATTLLLGVGGLVAMTQLGTNSAKKPATSQVPPTPVERRQLSQSQRERRPEPTDETPETRPHQPQVQSTPVSTKKIPSFPLALQRQSTLPPLPPLSQRWPMIDLGEEIAQPPPTPQYITLPGLPGLIDPADGIYREWQVKGDGLCGMYVAKAVLYHFFGEKKIKEITKEKYREKVPGPGSRIGKLVDFMNENGLDTREYYSKRIGGDGIANIEDADAFIIGRPRSSHGFHTIAMIRNKGGFHLSDPGHQNRREIYPGTVNEAVREYERRNNYTVDAVTTFHKSASAQGRHLNDPFTAASIRGNDGHEVLR